jgi:D-alanine transaminase
MNQIAFLNNEWTPLSQAKVSVLDRGFLFGDGIYEVIPVHHGKPVALNAHLARLKSGMNAVGMGTDNIDHQWNDIIFEIIKKNAGVNSPYQGLYIQITRGADTKRYHGFPSHVEQTQFAFMFDTPPPPVHDISKVNRLKVSLAEDLRWKRCHIKSTSLLGNVLHFQQGKDEGLAETILYNQQGMVTEASASNVFIVKQNTVITAPLDNQVLPGITRALALDALKTFTDIPVVERHFSTDELMAADEVWLSSSTKEITPVSHINQQQIGQGKREEIWLTAIKALNKIKFD